jgi:hypothetical protein
LGEKANNGKAVENVALPDALSFTGSNEAPLDSRPYQEARIGSNLIFSLRKISLNEGFT